VERELHSRKLADERTAHNSTLLRLVRILPSCTSRPKHGWQQQRPTRMLPRRSKTRLRANWRHCRPHNPELKQIWSL
jgi:hypothetical protein